MVMRWNTVHMGRTSYAHGERQKRKYGAHETHIRERQERKIQQHTINHRQASRIPLDTPL